MRDDESTSAASAAPSKTEVTVLGSKVYRGTSCTATVESAKRMRQIVQSADTDKARRASIITYSATVAPIPSKPAMPIHRSRPTDGSAEISRPGMSQPWERHFHAQPFRSNAKISDPSPPTGKGPQATRTRGATPHHLFHRRHPHVATSLTHSRASRSHAKQVPLKT